MAPKKKPSKNGFMQFVLEYREKSGRKFTSLEETQEAAGRIWQRMTKEEREPYQRLNELARHNFSKGRMATDGRELEEIEKEEAEKQTTVDEMKREINETIKKAADSLCLPDQMFFIIHINNLVYHPSTDRHFLCELAIAAFSLKEGLHPDNVFHRHIKPGKLPMGYYGDAKKHSDETHQLLSNVYDIDSPDDNNEEIFNDMIEFLRSTYNGQDFPPLYAHSKRMTLCQKVVNVWKEDFNFSDNLRVFNLEYMFYTLRNACVERPVWPSESFSIQQIDKDVYCYNVDLACEFHKMISSSIYCSRAIVIRSVYIICENCCADLNIKLKLGYHIPLKARVRTKSKSAADGDHSRENDVRYENNATELEFTSESDSESFSRRFPPLPSNGRQNLPKTLGHISPGRSYSQVSDRRLHSGTSSNSRMPRDDFPELGSERKNYSRRK